MLNPNVQPIILDRHQPAMHRTVKKKPPLVSEALNASKESTPAPTVAHRSRAGFIASSGFSWRPLSNEPPVSFPIMIEWRRYYTPRTHRFVLR